MLVLRKARRSEGRPRASLAAMGASAALCAVCLSRCGQRDLSWRCVRA